MQLEFHHGLLGSSQRWHGLTEHKSATETPRHRNSLCLCVSVACSLSVLRLLCVDCSGRIIGRTPSWQPVVRLQLHSAGAASRLAGLLLVQILPVFSLVAPCHPGASPPSVRRWSFTTGCKRQNASMCVYLTMRPRPGLTSAFVSCCSL